MGSEMCIRDRDETPHTSFCAHVPEPIIGVSPTRPGILFVIPPVEVAAAIFPSLSNATAPTVPILSSIMFLVMSFFLALYNLLRFFSD